MALDATTIEVYERNDPTVSVTLKRKDAAGVESAYNLTGATLEFYAKADTSIADAAAQIRYTNATSAITVTDAAGGKFEIRFSSADLTTPGTYKYHVDTVISGKRETVLVGDLTILNV
jgi:hypothetical protein